jgi:hypothetical protein
MAASAVATILLGANGFTRLFTDVRRLFDDAVARATFAPELRLERTVADRDRCTAARFDTP